MAVMESCARPSVTPTRSLEQRREALAKANRIRSYRARLKPQLKQGVRSVVDVVQAPEPELESMPVLDLLLAVPKVGRVKAMRLLSQSRMSPSKTLGGMTDRQRHELLHLIRRYG